MRGRAFPSIFFLFAVTALAVGGSACAKNVVASGDPSRLYETRSASYVENSDQAIEARVRAQLGRDPALGHRDFDVQVSEGSVTLEGTVASREEARRAVEIVRNVSGVKSIDNQIDVDPTATASP